MGSYTVTTKQKYVASKYDGLIHALPMAVLLVDPNGEVTSANQLACEMLGQKLIGQPWSSVSSKCFTPQSDDGFEISLQQGMRVQLLTSPIPTGEGQIVVLVDVTASRLLQKKLYHEKRLNQLGQMLAKMAHQLRTPLSSAILYTSTLKQYFTDVKNKNLNKNKKENLINAKKVNFTDVKKERMCEKIINSLKQLESNINDTLLFAKSGKQIVEIISLEEIFHSVLQTHNLKKLYPNVTLKLNCDSPETVLRINKHALVGAVVNLIVNAVESKIENKSITVKFSTETKNNHVRLSVTDNGKGIKEDEISNIIEPFYTTKSNGTGLGLAVVNSVVKMHDGYMDIQSKINIGTTVTLVLPIYIEEDNVKSA